MLDSGSVTVTESHSGWASKSRSSRAVVLVGLASPAVADDDRGPVDRCGQAGVHPVLDRDLRAVLGFLVVVVERLALLEVVFGEHAVVPAADVAGADVVEPIHVALGGELEDVFGAPDVDCLRQVAVDGEVVDGREVVDLANRRERLVTQSEVGFGNVTLVEPNLVVVDSVDSVGELPRSPACCLEVLRLDQTGDRPVAAGEDSLEQRGAEKARETGEENRGVAHGSHLASRR